ncbi:hypothetical protein M2272_000246 [Mycobacterium frederiksbergense]|uniref:PE family protein n=1 Tax=Mycolicibacterium frederiksbergense TaxID=117567 RepID=A0ABT6KUR4_9MYCO|nr:hypothetical protein [Mycolicibacterium frederiksbergense]
MALHAARDQVIHAAAAITETAIDVIASTSSTVGNRAATMVR